MGYFLVVAFTDNDINRIRNIQEVANATERLYGIKIKIMVVDARVNNKESASKL